MLILRTERKVAERDNAYELLVPIDDRQAADLFFLHKLGSLFDALIVKTPKDIRRHDVTHRRGYRITTVSNGADGEITVRNRTNQPLSVAHGQHANVTLLHHFCRFANHRGGLDHMRIFG